MFIDLKQRKNSDESALIDAPRAYGPVAKGSLSQVYMKCNQSGCRVCKSGKGHPAWIFAYRVDGKRKCLYVRKADVSKVQSAIDCGRRVEVLLLEEGVRLIKSLRAESNVRHADETKWPCNGAHSQYVWGFFARFVALFLFWRTRGATVPRVVLAGVKDGVTVHDGYTAYDKPCKEASQQCCRCSQN